MLWTTESSQLGMVGVIIYLQGQLHGLESTGGTGRPPIQKGPTFCGHHLEILNNLSIMPGLPDFR